LERKLTAILCADVFGYSRLMGEDEEATLRTLSSHRKLIDSLIEQHRGRFVNFAGDSVLAEFASVVNGAFDVESERSGGKLVDASDVVAEQVATLGLRHLFHHLLQLLDVVAGVVGMRKV
jgi:class 3 adenylate cyclase